jgi:Ca2+-binding EF-hand superfamily protein
MSFNPQDYASAFITTEEVIEIKKAFDFFDRDLGGAIDPKGTARYIQSSKLPSIPSVSRPRPKQSIK